LKKSASGVLASLRGSTYGTKVRFASSLAAALLEGLFEQPAGSAGTVRDFLQLCFAPELQQLCNILLAAYSAPISIKSPIAC
jgi:hypothetical protein